MASACILDYRSDFLLVVITFELELFVFVGFLSWGVWVLFGSCESGVGGDAIFGVG